MLGPSGSDTFFVGTADGRTFQYETTSYETGGCIKVKGEGHTNLVSAVTARVGGQVYSAGFDDKLREIDPAVGFTCVSSSSSHPFVSLKSTWIGSDRSGKQRSPSSVSQKRLRPRRMGRYLSFTLRRPAGPMSKPCGTTRQYIPCNRRTRPSRSLRLAALSSWVARFVALAFHPCTWVTRELTMMKTLVIYLLGPTIVQQDDKKVHVYTWDGLTSTLIENAVSESVSTRGQVTTVAVSADGVYIAAGDVRLPSVVPARTLTNG